MPFEPNQTQQVIRVPLRRISERYGRDNDDLAGDEMVSCLRQITPTLRYTFGSSTGHPNPWYHTLDFGIQGISEHDYHRLIECLTTQGLVED